MTLVPGVVALVDAFDLGPILAHRRWHNPEPGGSVVVVTSKSTWAAGSDVGAVPGSASQRLHSTLLEQAHIPEPYALAGHSFGGLYVLRFAAKFPDQVAGLVDAEGKVVRVITTCAGRDRSAGRRGGPTKVPCGVVRHARGESLPGTGLFRL